MNYYPFHVGDYAAHTSHLEPMEDLAYRRMLDLYYLREEPLPTDPSAVARLVRMRANASDIEAVLQEFFVLGAQGWSHTRCDDEISRMQEKLDASDEKDQHEKDRMQRYRERRAAMFAALRERGFVPAWDISMKDLQRLFDESCNAPVTPPATAPATPATQPETDLQRVQAISGDAPATAIPTPTPTPTPIKEEGETRKRATTPIRPDDVDEQVWQDWVQLRKAKKATVSPTVIAEARIEAGKAGLTLERFLAVWCARGSQGLMADWLKPNERMTPAANQAESFAERDARNSRERYTQMTGREWPADELPGAAKASAMFIDVESTEIKRLSK